MSRPVAITLLSVAILTLLLPAAWNVYVSTVLHDWRGSARFNGQNYLASTESYEAAHSDPTGVAAALATLLNWSGVQTTEAEVLDRFEESDYTGNLADFTAMAHEYGLDGQWLQADAAALSRLNVPFIAHMTDGGGRVVIVRDARSGFIYATDPGRGQVVYPLEKFTDTWTGQVFAFPDPPAQPEEWR